MTIDELFDILKQAPLVALCILLVWGLKVVYTDAKKDRKYSKSEELKNMETLTRVLAVVKELALEKRSSTEADKELSKEFTALTVAINTLINKVK